MSWGRHFSRRTLAILVIGKVCVTGEAQVQPGMLDEAFRPGMLYEIDYLAGAWGKVIGLQLGPRDEVYIGGHFTQLWETTWKPANGIARLSEDGRMDESFSVPPYDSANFYHHIDAHDIFVTDDGRVWCGFSFFSERFTESGTVNPLTGPGASFITTVYPDGRWLAWYGSNGHSEIRRYLSDGTLDGTFTPFSDWQQSTRLILRDERILVERFASQEKTTLKRYLSNGRVDSSYQVPVFGTNETVDVLLERANGQVYIAGSFSTVNGTPRPGVARLNENGTLEESFLPDERFNGSGPNRAMILCLALQANGKLLVGGSFSKVNAPLNSGIVRLNLDGTLDSSFDAGSGATEGNYEDGGQFSSPAKISKVAVQRNGKILVSGDFRKFNGVARDGIARLHGDRVEALQIRSFRKVSADQAELEMNGTADVFELEETSGLGSNWISLKMVSMTNEVSTKVEVSIDSSDARFFRVKRQ